MTKQALILTVCVAAISGVVATSSQTSAATGAPIGERVPQFAAQLIDVSGEQPKPADFDSHKTQRPTVYIFVGTTCPATAAYVERLRALEKTYGEKGVDFIYLYPNRDDAPE